jgi:hypothetical protein
MTLPLILVQLFPSSRKLLRPAAFERNGLEKAVILAESREWPPCRRPLSAGDFLQAARLRTERENALSGMVKSCRRGELE